MVSFTPRLPCPHRKIPLNPLEVGGSFCCRYVKAVLNMKITTCVENRETSPVLSILNTLTELSRPVRQFVRSDNIEKQSGKESDRQNTEHERKNVIFVCVTSRQIPTSLSVPSYYCVGTTSVLLASNLIPLFNLLATEFFSNFSTPCI